LFLPKNLLSIQLGVELSFQWDTFGMKRMIRDKMIHSDFFCYNINIDFPFRAQNFNLRVGGFLVFSKKTNLVELQPCLWEGKNIHMLRGFSVFFFLLKQCNYGITLGFWKKRRLHVGVFLSFPYGFVVNIRWGQG
jgi:hypothetical protein